jgi:hypothetical protein
MIAVSGQEQEASFSKALQGEEKAFRLSANLGFSENSSL